MSYIGNIDKARKQLADVYSIHRHIWQLWMQKKTLKRKKRPGRRVSRLLELRSKESASMSELRANFLATQRECLAKVEVVSENPRTASRFSAGRPLPVYPHWNLARQNQTSKCRGTRVLHLASTTDIWLLA